MGGDDGGDDGRHAAMGGSMEADLGALKGLAGAEDGEMGRSVSYPSAATRGRHSSWQRTALDAMQTGLGVGGAPATSRQARVGEWNGHLGSQQKPANDTIRWWGKHWRPHDLVNKA